jgi:hypothetical protein
LNLVRASNPDDQIFVVNFGQSPYLDQDFTSNLCVAARLLRGWLLIGGRALGRTSR